VGRNQIFYTFPVALSIKSEEADRLAQELDTQTGKFLTAVIIMSLRERMAHQRAAGGPATVKRIPLLQAQVAELLMLNDCSPNDVIGYDRHGLPQ
jgi:antitoxin VapB